MNEAFHYGEKRRHAGIQPKAEHITTDFLSPEETNLNQQASISFRIRIPPDQFLRLAKNPIMIKYKIRYPNPAYEAEGDTAAKKVAKHWLMSINKAPSVYIEPLEEFAFFFSKVDLNIDSRELQYASSSDQSQAAILSHFNRCLLNDSERNMLYFKHNMIKETADRKFNAPTDNLKKALYTTDFGGIKDDDVSSRIINTAPESVFGMGYPNNGYLSKILKSPLDTQYPFFPPGSEIVYTLHRNQTVPGQYLHSDIVDGNYFGGASATDVPDYDVVLEDVCLVTQSVRLEHAPTQMAIKGLSKAVMKFPFDYSTLQVAMIEHGRSRTTTKFLIDESTKLIQIGYLEEHQYQFTKSKNKFTSALTKIPKLLDSIEFRLNKEHLCFSQPLSDLTSTGLYKSMSARLYYNYLRERGLFDGEYEDLFPRDAADCNYRQIFVLDCTTLRVAGSSSLDIDCIWNGASPPSLRMVCVSVREAMYSRDSKSDWHFSILK